MIRAWGTEAGLPQNTVTAMIQSREGYLWLGTRDGLARFDGVRFRSYGLQEGLQSVEIMCLLEDQADALWVGTSGGGLAKWKDGRFESVPLHFQDGGGEIITALAKDVAGCIWVGTRAGLRLIRGGEVQEVEALKGLSKEVIRALLWDRSGGMWIATARGLYEYREGRLSGCAGPAGQVNIIAHCLLADQRGGLWASIGDGKVLCRREGEWKTYDQSDGLPFAFVSCLTEDANGTVWAGSLDSGLYFLEAGKFKAIKQADGLSADDIRSLKLDREGNLWVGTRTGGLNRLTQGGLMHCGARQGLTNDFTRAVAETASGEIWVGTTGGGVYRGSPNALAPFQPEPVGGYYAHIEAVLAARDGGVWWGGNNGLLRWKEGSPLLALTNGPFAQSTTTALAEDAEGAIWIGTSESRLLRWQTGTLTEFPQRVTRGAVTAFAVEPDGHLWVGSVAGGLKRIQAGSASILTVTNNSMSDSIRTLHRDPEGDLWIGTAGDGLGYWHRGKLTNFSAAQGLSARTVLQILEDDLGNLWLGTSQGIFRARKRDLKDCAAGRITFVHTRFYGLNDGMPAQECSGGFCPAGLKSRSGLLCFSTVRGLVFIDPRKQSTEPPPPRSLIEQVFVNGKEASLELAGYPVRIGATEQLAVGRVVIPPGDRDLEIRYTAIQLSSPEKVGFRYRMDDADPDWIEAGGERTASYQRLPPGEYLFRLKACNANGTWNEHETVLALQVMPFLWERSGFRAVGVLAFAGIFAATLAWQLRLRYQRGLARLQRLNTIERERLRISQDMHDHIGGMLTQVSQLSDMGLHETETEQQAKNRFERIGDRARLAVQALDEIVWATNPKNDNLASFVDYVSRFSDEFFEYSRTRCWQELPTNIPPLALRADVRHTVFLAVREALNNVLKHSGATEVWLRFTHADGRATLEIEDNGCGFDPQKAGSAGNGLENMRARLTEEGGQAELTSAPGKGTKVRFVFPLPS